MRTNQRDEAQPGVIFATRLEDYVLVRQSRQARDDRNMFTDCTVRSPHCVCMCEREGEGHVAGQEMSAMSTSCLDDVAFLTELSNSTTTNWVSRKFLKDHISRADAD